MLDERSTWVRGALLRRPRREPLLAAPPHRITSDVGSSSGPPRGPTHHAGEGPGTPRWEGAHTDMAATERVLREPCATVLPEVEVLRRPLAAPRSLQMMQLASSIAGRGDAAGEERLNKDDTSRQRRQAGAGNGCVRATAWLLADRLGVGRARGRDHRHQPGGGWGARHRAAVLERAAEAGEPKRRRADLRRPRGGRHPSRPRDGDRLGLRAGGGRRARDPRRPPWSNGGQRLLAPPTAVSSDLVHKG